MTITTKTCSVDGCETVLIPHINCKELCKKHYARMRRHGDTNLRYKIHGKSRSLEYKTWTSLKGRCYNPKNPLYKWWGARGIKVCDRWLNSFEAFHEDMGDRPSSKHSLDRINVNGDYEPSNCRWATRDIQDNNTTRNKHLTHNGETKTVHQWAAVTGINESTIRSRLAYGWPEELVLTVNKYQHHKKANRTALAAVTMEADEA